MEAKMKEVPTEFVPREITITLDTIEEVASLFAHLHNVAGELEDLARATRGHKYELLQKFGIKNIINKKMYFKKPEPLFSVVGEILVEEEKKFNIRKRKASKK